MHTFSAGEVLSNVMHIKLTLKGVCDHWIASVCYEIGKM